MDRLHTWADKPHRIRKVEEVAQALADKKFKAVSAAAVPQAEKEAGEQLSREEREMAATRANELLAVAYAACGRPARK